MTKIKDSVVFITGGAGFIGSHVVEQLLPLQPSKIIIIDNFIRGKKENMSNFANLDEIEFIEGDIRDAKLIEQCMKFADYCFHMAALRINACVSDPKEAFDVMVKSTFDIIDSAKRNDIQKFIFSSSASIYGLSQNFPTPEDDHPYDNQTFYGAAKLFGEQILRSYKHMHGLDYVALRYFNVYGPRMDTDGKYTEVMIKWLDCIREGRVPQIYGDGKTSMDFIFVEDVATANVKALLSKATDQTFNVGCQRETTLLQLLNTLQSVNNSNLKPQFLKENTVNPVSRRLANIAKSKQLLDFKPKYSLTEGLKLLSEWYFNQTMDKVN